VVHNKRQRLTWPLRPKTAVTNPTATTRGGPVEGEVRLCSTRCLRHGPWHILPQSLRFSTSAPLASWRHSHDRLCPSCGEVIRHEAGRLRARGAPRPVRACGRSTQHLDGKAPALRLRTSNAVKTAELNVHHDRSIMDVFEQVRRGVRLMVRARPQSRGDRDIPPLSSEAPDLFVDLSHLPDSAKPHHHPRQITLSEILAAMMRTARSLAEKKAGRRLAKRTRKRK